MTSLPLNLQSDTCANHALDLPTPVLPKPVRNHCLRNRDLRLSLPRCFRAGLLSSTVILLTLAPLPLCVSAKGSLPFSLTLQPSGRALAQSIAPTGPNNTQGPSSTQLTDYARAVLEIEQIRLKYYQQAEQLTRRVIPQNTCLGNSKANVPPGLENICSSYLSDSKQVIERYNLTPEQFNEITSRARNDTSLMNRIQLELVKLKRSRQP